MNDEVDISCKMTAILLDNAINLLIETCSAEDWMERDDECSVGEEAMVLKPRIC